MEMLKAYFTAHPPHSMKYVAAEIEEKTGAKRISQQMRLFLRSLGLRPLRTSLLPAEANTKRQKDFRNRKLVPRLEEAHRGERTVFCVDAAHFVLGRFLATLWSFIRVWVKSTVGTTTFQRLGGIECHHP